MAEIIQRDGGAAVLVRKRYGMTEESLLLRVQSQRPVKEMRLRPQKAPRLVEIDILGKFPQRNVKEKGKEGSPQSNWETSDY